MVQSQERERSAWTPLLSCTATSMLGDGGSIVCPTTLMSWKKSTLSTSSEKDPVTAPSGRAVCRHTLWAMARFGGRTVRGEILDGRRRWSGWLDRLWLGQPMYLSR